MLGNSVRPISEADSILAVYYDNWGFMPSEPRRLVTAAWPDGTVVWSNNAMGGAPFRIGKTDPKRVVALLTRLEKEGLFSETSLVHQPSLGPDSAFLTVLVKRGKKAVELRSWHELAELRDTLVADDHGISVLSDKTRLATLKEASKEYLLFRMVYNDIRRRLAELIPAESRVSTGQTELKHGVFTWVKKKGK